MSDSSPAGKPPALWRNRDYVLLWLGQAVSAVGTGISQFAFPLLVLSLTRSFTAAGLAGTLGQLPYLLFSLPAGALVDRWDRKRVMLTCTLGLALCLASIPVALLGGHLTILQIYIVAFLMGTFSVFDQLAGLGALTQVVPKAQLSNAVAQNEVVYSSVQLLAPSLGGLLLSVGSALPFLADVVSYCLLFVSLLNIRTSFQSVRNEEQQHLLREVWEGIAWLWSHAVVRVLAFLTSYLYVVMSASILIVYALARQQGISIALIGLILGIGGGGNVVGTLLCPVVQRRVPFGRALIGLLALLVLLWPLYGLVGSPILLAIVVVGLAVIDSVSSILMTSYRLGAVPDNLQGRVGSVYRLLIFGALALSQYGTGYSIEHFGVKVTLAVLWGGLVVFAGLSVLYVPLRRASLPLAEN